MREKAGETEMKKTSDNIASSAAFSSPSVPSSSQTEKRQNVVQGPPKANAKQMRMSAYGDRKPTGGS